MSTSEQARADAMADAETLRAFLAGPGWPAVWAINLQRAEDNGTWAAEAPNAQTAHAAAEYAARAAFRAVPGLRG